MKKNITFFVLVILLICMSSPAFAAARVRIGNMVSVDGATVNMRSGPGRKYGIKWEMDKGYPLRVIGMRGNWLKVRDFEDDEGWIYKKLVSRKPYLVVKMNRDSNKKFKINEGPSENASVVGEAGAGTVFRVLAWRDNWVKLSHNSGLSGWVDRSLLINIRSGPGTGYEIVGQAAYGSLFRTIKRGNGWVKVRHQSGLTGWIKRSLLWGW